MNLRTVSRLVREISLIVLLLLSGGCASGGASREDGGNARLREGGVGNPGQAPAQFAPLIDYHQHLVSSRGADWLYQRKIPNLELPDELASVLRRRAERWNDSIGLAELYSAESVAFTSSDNEGRTRMTVMSSGIFHVLWSRVFRRWRVQPAPI